MNRETWLNALAEKMAPRFTQLGWTLPKFRLAVGFTSRGAHPRIGGECWNKSKSADGHFEIMIAPHLDDAMTVAATLAHELTHAAVGFSHGHKGDFAKCMAALGLVRPFTQSLPGPKFAEWVKPLLDQIGAFPHAALCFHKTGPAVRPQADGQGPSGEDQPDGERQDEDGQVIGGGSSNARKKQTTRLKKAICGECGYTVRVTSKWLEVGPPHCPLHGAMECEDDGGE